MSWEGFAMRRGLFFGQDELYFDGKFFARNFIAPNGRVYYVDKGITTSGNGSRWSKAFKTIQEAITASNSTIDWGANPWLVDNWIVVAPGEYAEALTAPYSAHIIGMGVLGTDTAVEIHPALGSPLSGTGLGLHLANLRFETTESKDVIDFGICNNCFIENCELVCGVAATGAHAFLSTENCTHLRLYNCSLQYGGGGVPYDYGLHFAGGADKFLHHSDIKGNIIQGVKSAGTGIYIQNTCTATNTIIQENIIKIAGIAKGIDDNNGGTLCVRNNITIAGAGDAIEHAGGAGMTINNQVVVNGVAARETA